MLSLIVGLGGVREYDVLFWPTVGAILSGVNPGVSLYSVLIFSSSVCPPKGKKTRPSSAHVTNSLACSVQPQYNYRELFLSKSVSIH